MRETAVVNESTLIEDAPVITIVADAQQALNEIFLPHWPAASATLGFASGSGGWKTPPGMSAIILLDDTDQANVLGYHDAGPNGEPLGKVFLRQDILYGANPSITFTHELFELLVDPLCNTLRTMADGRNYILEVCDAVEDDALAFRVNKTMISSFVLPAYFEPGSTGPWDIGGALRGPCPELAPGGYISWTDGSAYHQIMAQTDARARSAARAHLGSRRFRRTIPYAERLWSTRKEKEK